MKKDVVGNDNDICFFHCSSGSIVSTGVQLSSSRGNFFDVLYFGQNVFFQFMDSFGSQIWTPPDLFIIFFRVLLFRTFLRASHHIHASIIDERDIIAVVDRGVRTEIASGSQRHQSYIVPESCLLDFINKLGQLWVSPTGVNNLWRHCWFFFSIFGL